jgi:hypothetical protein
MKARLSMVNVNPSTSQMSDTTFTAIESMIITSSALGG